MGREGEFPSLSAITRTQPSKHPFKRAPEGYAISDYSWYSAHSAPANRRHHLFPLCTIMTRSRRTKVRGGGTALSRPACHWPYDKAANSKSLLHLDYCFASACHLSLGLLEEELTTLFHTDAPCTTSSARGGMASSPRFPFRTCLCNAFLTTFVGNLSGIS
ncbi:uncharacterized protein CCOS01_10457 [Colletotrichum costaricense]|uniref:Uncharacterized protein n=1 Tax=Colletotrichum costaricense TaxID=1209916 RepID=A0AAJ0DXV5_9PEZI|nr:uncharacterized protein CCOS01_10457 [Colletotrichum costaricense]KAI3536967.1 hypothetical protein CSPX01_10464 [Colletotrichum filicis]KAK1520338.1 hypothetical protein CCOS01_10457 [Colletotrichum costaricense]